MSCCIPSFPAEPFERERRIQLESIRAQRDQLLQSCGQAMRRALFGPAATAWIPPAPRKACRPASLPGWRLSTRDWSSPTIACWPFSATSAPPQVKAAVQKILGRWEKGAPVIPALPETIGLTEIRRVADTRDKAQAVMVIGFPGATLLDADRYPLELLQEGCSDLGSRLFLRIREKLGLAYYVGAQNFPAWLPDTSPSTSAPRRKNWPKSKRNCWPRPKCCAPKA